MNQRSRPSIRAVHWLVLVAGWVSLTSVARGAMPPTNQFPIRCTVILQTRSDRLYCFVTNDPVRVVLKDPAEYANGEVVEVTSISGAVVVTTGVQPVLAWLGSTVRRLGETHLPPPLHVKPSELTNGALNYRRVAVVGRVTSHEVQYFVDHYIEILNAEGTDGLPFRVEVFNESNARERMPVGTVVEFVGLSYTEVFLDGAGPLAQVDMKNFDECTILRPAPWLTLERARLLVFVGAALALVGGVWLVRERYQIGRLRTAERAVRQLNAELESRVAQRTAAVQQSEAQFRALYEISSAVLVVEDLDSLYARIHDTVRSVMRAENFFLLLHNPATDLHEYVYHVDQMDAWPKSRKVSGGLVGYILRTGRSLRVDRASMTNPQNEWCSVSGTPSAIWLGVPLRVRGQTIGVMAVQDYHEATAYGEAEEKILTYMATQAALAIEGKRAEAEMERALANERELSELKSRFVSMVSHEFRTPLGIISSSAEILDAYLERLSPEERKANLRDITDATRHMTRMMEEVLLLGRVEAGKITCRPAPMNLAVFCAKLVDELTSATAARCPIELKLAAGLGEAMADESLLRHILTNLLNNAVKYSPPGATVEFSVEAREYLAIFSVCDHGIGIPEADQRQLFQAFHRGHNVGETPGTGLGMVIVKHCAQLHGGRIAFESRECHGSTFTVALPLFGQSGAFGHSPTQLLRASTAGPNSTVVP